MEIAGQMETITKRHHGEDNKRDGARKVGNHISVAEITNEHTDDDKELIVIRYAGSSDGPHGDTGKFIQHRTVC